MLATWNSSLWRCARAGPTRDSARANTPGRTRRASSPVGRRRWSRCGRHGGRLDHRASLPPESLRQGCFRTFAFVAMLRSDCAWRSRIGRPGLRHAARQVDVLSVRHGSPQVPHGAGEGFAAALSRKRFRRRKTHQCHERGELTIGALPTLTRGQCAHRTQESQTVASGKFVICPQERQGVDWDAELDFRSHGPIRERWSLRPLASFSMPRDRDRATRACRHR